MQNKVSFLIATFLAIWLQATATGTVDAIRVDLPMQHPIPGIRQLDSATSFERTDTWSGREADLNQGIEAPRIRFHFVVPPGPWSIMVYLDDGYRDAHLTKFTVNGQVHSFTGHEFGLEKEPSPPPIDRYRVQQLKVECGSEGISFEAIAPHGGKARLLKVEVLSRKPDKGPKGAYYLDRLNLVGSLDSTIPLKPLLVDMATEEQMEDDLSDAPYWNHLIHLLDFAEEQYTAKGWDWLSNLTGTSMFTRYKQAVSVLDGLVESSASENNPLYPRALWLRARLLYWIYQEQHLETDWVTAQRDLARLADLYPEHTLVRMYNGEQIDQPDSWDNWTASPDTPEWAAVQIETRGRLRDVAHYWVDQQIDNGEMGGKPDDDVELFRWWPALILTGDTKALSAYERLSDGVWYSRRVLDGFSRAPRDVEHSAEFISDTAPGLALFTRRKHHIERLEPSVRYMRDLWTGYNEQDQLQFKSAWIGSREILLEPPRNRDVSMSARAVKPVRYYAWLTGDTTAIRLIHEWGKTWADAALSTDKDKPAGVFPASIRWPDGSINGDEPNWHIANMFWPYFDWSGDGRMYDHCYFSYLMTQDPYLLEPLYRTLDLLDQYRRNKQTDQEIGSAAWAAEQLMQGDDFWGVVAQWRLEQQDSRWDQLLLDSGPAYLKYRLTGDKTLMVRELQDKVLAELRYNFPMRTSEVLFTDRVRISSGGSREDGISTLIAMLTGCAVPAAMSPYYAVAWDPLPVHAAALVEDASPNRLKIHLYADIDSPAKVALQALRLKEGRYDFSIYRKNKVISTQPVEITASSRRIEFSLLHREEITISLLPVDHK